LNGIVTVQCSGAAKVWGTAGLCSVLRLAFRGLNECEVGTGLIAYIISEAHDDDYSP